MKRVVLVLALLKWYCPFSATETETINYQPHFFYQTYENIYLNPRTIAYFATSDAFTIKDPLLLAWLRKHKNLLVSLATHIIYKSLKDYLKSHKKGVMRGSKLLKKYKLINRSWNNFIFCIQPEKSDKRYWIKIAGPHRLQQLNIDLKEMLSSGNIQKWVRNVTTYQNASRFARYLLYQKWKNNNHDVPLKVPATYLFSLSKDGLIDDRYCIIIEEDFPYMGDNYAILRALLATQSHVKDFIVHLGLWDLHPSQFVIASDGELVCIDLEDVDKSSPAMFFNKDYEKIKKHIKFGLGEFEKMLEKAQ